MTNKLIVTEESLNRYVDKIMQLPIFTKYDNDISKDSMEVFIKSILKYLYLDIPADIVSFFENNNETEKIINYFFISLGIEKESVAELDYNTKLRLMSEVINTMRKKGSKQVDETFIFIMESLFLNVNLYHIVVNKNQNNELEYVFVPFGERYKSTKSLPTKKGSIFTAKHWVSLEDFEHINIFPYYTNMVYYDFGNVYRKSIYDWSTIRHEAGQEPIFNLIPIQDTEDNTLYEIPFDVDDILFIEVDDMIQTFNQWEKVDNNHFRLVAPHNNRIKVIGLSKKEFKFNVYGSIIDEHTVEFDGRINVNDILFYVINGKIQHNLNVYVEPRNTLPNAPILPHKVTFDIDLNPYDIVVAVGINNNSDLEFVECSYNGLTITPVKEVDLNNIVFLEVDDKVQFNEVIETRTDGNITLTSDNNINSSVNMLVYKKYRESTELNEKVWYKWDGDELNVLRTNLYKYDEGYQLLKGNALQMSNGNWVWVVYAIDGYGTQINVDSYGNEFIGISYNMSSPNYSLLDTSYIPNDLLITKYFLEINQPDVDILWSDKYYNILVDDLPYLFTYLRLKYSNVKDDDLFKITNYHYIKNVNDLDKFNDIYDKISTNNVDNVHEIYNDWLRLYGSNLPTEFLNTFELEIYLENKYPKLIHAIVNEGFNGIYHIMQLFHVLIDSDLVSPEYKFLQINYLYDEMYSIISVDKIYKQLVAPITAYFSKYLYPIYRENILKMDDTLSIKNLFNSMYLNDKTNIHILSKNFDFDITRIEDRRKFNWERTEKDEIKYNYLDWIRTNTTDKFFYITRENTHELDLGLHNKNDILIVYVDDVCLDINQLNISYNKILFPETYQNVIVIGLNQNFSDKLYNKKVIQKEYKISTYDSLYSHYFLVINNKIYQEKYDIDYITNTIELYEKFEDSDIRLVGGLDGFVFETLIINNTGKFQTKTDINKDDIVFIVIDGVLYNPNDYITSVNFNEIVLNDTTINKISLLYYGKNDIEQIEITEQKHTDYSIMENEQWLYFFNDKVYPSDFGTPIFDNSIYTNEPIYSNEVYSINKIQGSFSYYPSRIEVYGNSSLLIFDNQVPFLEKDIYLSGFSHLNQIFQLDKHILEVNNNSLKVDFIVNDIKDFVLFGVRSNLNWKVFELELQNVYTRTLPKEIDSNYPIVVFGDQTPIKNYVINYHNNTITTKEIYDKVMVLGVNKHTIYEPFTSYVSTPSSNSYPVYDSRKVRLVYTENEFILNYVKKPEAIEYDSIDPLTIIESKYSLMFTKSDYLKFNEFKPNINNPLLTIIDGNICKPIYENYKWIVPTSFFNKYGLIQIDANIVTLGEEYGSNFISENIELDENGFGIVTDIYPNEIVLCIIDNKIYDAEIIENIEYKVGKITLSSHPNKEIIVVGYKKLNEGIYYDGITYSTDNGYVTTDDFITNENSLILDHEISKIKDKLKLGYKNEYSVKGNPTATTVEFLDTNIKIEYDDIIMFIIDDVVFPKEEIVEEVRNNVITTKQNLEDMEVVLVGITNNPGYKLLLGLDDGDFTVFPDNTNMNTTLYFVANNKFIPPYKIEHNRNYVKNMGLGLNYIIAQIDDKDVLEYNNKNIIGLDLDGRFKPTSEISSKTKSSIYLKTPYTKYGFVLTTDDDMIETQTNLGLEYNVTYNSDFNDIVGLIINSKLYSKDIITDVNDKTLTLSVNVNNTEVTLIYGSPYYQVSEAPLNINTATYSVATNFDNILLITSDTHCYVKEKCEISVKEKTIRLPFDDTSEKLYILHYLNTNKVLYKNKPLFGVIKDNELYFDYIIKDGYVLLQEPYINNVELIEFDEKIECISAHKITDSTFKVDSDIHKIIGVVANNTLYNPDDIIYEILDNVITTKFSTNIDKLICSVGSEFTLTTGTIDKNEVRFETKYDLNSIYLFKINGNYQLPKNTNYTVKDNYLVFDSNVNSLEVLVKLKIKNNVVKVRDYNKILFMKENNKIITKENYYISDDNTTLYLKEKYNTGLIIYYTNIVGEKYVTIGKTNDQIIRLNDVELDDIYLIENDGIYYNPSEIISGFTDNELTLNQPLLDTKIYILKNHILKYEKGEVNENVVTFSGSIDLSKIEYFIYNNDMKGKTFHKDITIDNNTVTFPFNITSGIGVLAEIKK